jgi:hypothetical protein
MSSNSHTGIVDEKLAVNEEEVCYGYVREDSKAKTQRQRELRLVKTGRTMVVTRILVQKMTLQTHWMNSGLLICSYHSSNVMKLREFYSIEYEL